MHWDLIARHQGGVIGRRQLLACELTTARIDAMVRGGVLRNTPHRGLYRAAGAPVTEQVRA